MPLHLIIVASLSLFLCGATSLAAEKSLNVVYPNVNGLGQDGFGFRVLRLALQKSGEPFELTFDQQSSNNERIRLRLAQNKVSIADFGTSREFEEIYRAIYFPIDLGLNGWRIFLINRKGAFRPDNTWGLSELLAYKAGQGAGWSDVRVLRDAGLSVEEVPDFENLFKMLALNRFDYFPLGANEVHFLKELYDQEAPGLEVEEDLLLIYPFARFFFVHKDNEALHDAVYLGLTRAFEDGSLKALYTQETAMQNFLLKSDLLNRKKILIENRYLTIEFQKIDTKYFMSDELFKELLALLAMKDRNVQ
jgi:hypothetical protein